MHEEQLEEEKMLQRRSSKKRPLTFNERVNPMADYENA